MEIQNERTSNQKKLAEGLHDFASGIENLSSIEMTPQTATAILSGVGFGVALGAGRIEAKAVSPAEIESGAALIRVAFATVIPLWASVQTKKISCMLIIHQE